MKMNHQEQRNAKLSEVSQQCPFDTLACIHSSYYGLPNRADLWLF